MKQTLGIVLITIAVIIFSIGSFEMLLVVGAPGLLLSIPISAIPFFVGLGLLKGYRKFLFIGLIIIFILGLIPLALTAIKLAQ